MLPSTFLASGKLSLSISRYFISDFWLVLDVFGLFFPTSWDASIASSALATTSTLTVDSNGDVGFCRASPWCGFLLIELWVFPYLQDLFPAVKLCSLSSFIVFPVVLFHHHFLLY